ncbi:hypothetical protein ABI060_14205, partial [Enterococcus faecium]|uniref:hypothetical protein n=1 Tax=Enterococcus faecium TaxID=1352 RepID=UPI003F4240CA
ETTGLDRAVVARSGPKGDAASDASRPLVLDLDGTLLRTDMLLECIIAALRQNPLMVFSILLWALQGRAVLKQRLALQASPDIATLPVDQRVVAR